ncbi:hypothetical protein ABB02_00222 [Clostridiaceae bacterium JG1575]|nr:hypothetical protein ABB02_00222 [Clostridiaceae bacterium JG1575]
MLGLPRSTEVNRRVAKEKIYAHATMTPSLRDIIKNQVESIIWRNKLSDTTIGLATGQDVKEIQVLEISLRQQSLDKRVLSAINKAIPYKIVFILTFEDVAQTWIEVSDTFYCTEWYSVHGAILKLEGLNLDTVYETMARNIARGRLDSGKDLAYAVEKDKLRLKLEREISHLNKKMLREKQFNKQVELNGELKRLQEELEHLNG